MGTMLIVLPLALAVLGIVVFAGGIRSMFKGKPGRGTAGAGAGGLVAIVGLAAGLFGLNMQTYARLTYEAPVAKISVKAIDQTQKLYEVTVDRLDSTKIHTVCRIQGDEWELGGRVQKWKPWANVIGLNATYTVEQLTNRYTDPLEGNGKIITACDLRGPPPAIEQYLPHSVVEWLVNQAMAGHRKFGSANYMPLADGAVYQVVITQTGFNAEPLNDKAHAANDQRDILNF